MQRPEDCLVHLRTTESVKLRTLFETLNPILVEGSLQFTPQGMLIKGVNLVILCDLIVRADDVEDYACKEPQHVSINFNTLYTCLSTVGQSEAICFQITSQSINAPTPYMSVFVIHSSSQDEYVFHYQVTLLALDKEQFEVPDTKFQSVVSIPSASFHRVLRCCQKSGDSVQICTRTQGKNENYIIFSTDGDEANLRFHMRFQCEQESDWQDNSCLKMDRYSLKYLMLITKATSLSHFVTLYLASDFVLAMRYNIGSIGEITFCLAPMVDKATTVPPPVVPVENVFPMPPIQHKPQQPPVSSDTESKSATDDAEATKPRAKPKRCMQMVDKGEKPKLHRRRKRKTATDNSTIGDTLKQRTLDVHFSGRHLPSVCGKDAHAALTEGAARHRAKTPDRPLTPVADRLVMPVS